MTHTAQEKELLEIAVLWANRIGSPWGEGATYDRSRTEPEDPADIDEDDRQPNGRLYSHLPDDDFELFVADITEYIAADRKRVALEARIAERNKIALDNYMGKTVSESTNWQAKFEYFMDSNERRIAELKAQQEEV